MAMPDEKVHVVKVDIKEHELWHRNITKGIFRQQVIGTQEITNARVLENGNGYFWNEIDDIVVMNRYTLPESQRSLTGSNAVGDLVFMKQGAAVITFRQVRDPTGVTNIANSARKAVMEMLKQYEKEYRANLARQETTDATITCVQCNHSNAADSKFCGNCGKSLIPICPKCNKQNPPGASFCGQCGLPLS